MMGCPYWPSCGCGTQSGPHTCEWRLREALKMTTKETNPKDSIGINKAPMFSYVSRPALAMIGLAMMEGGHK
jgi:hypothetical protein